MPTMLTFQRWSYVVISTTLALLILASFWVEKTIRQQLQSEIRRALESVLKAETRGVRAWYSQQQLLAEALAKDPLILRALEPGSQVSTQELKAWLSHTPYLDFVLASADGKALYSSQARASQAWASVSTQARQQVQKGHVQHGKSRLIETFVKTQGREETQLAMLIPIVGQGLLLLRLDPRRSFPSLLQGDFWGKSAETYLIDLHGVMLTPSRFESQLKSLQILAPGQSSALHLKVRHPANLQESSPRTSHQKHALTPMAADLIAGRSGTRLQPYLDYRGVQVIGSWHWDSELGLGIVTEMDADEAFQSMYHTELLLYGFTFFAVCLLLGLSYAFYDNHQSLEKMTELLQLREVRFHSIFDNAQDATLIFEGEVIQDCNPAALSLLGYAKHELVGLSWHAISPLYQPAGQSSMTDSRGRLLDAMTGKKLRFDWRFENSQGEQFNADVRLNPLQMAELYYCQATIRERPAEPA